MTEKPKDCPFCGGEAFLADDDEKNYGVFIACSKCCSSTGIFKTKDEALVAWNARSIENGLAEEIKKLEKKNRTLNLALAEIAIGFDTKGWNYTREEMMKIAKEVLE